MPNANHVLHVGHVALIHGHAPCIECKIPGDPFFSCTIVFWLYFWLCARVHITRNYAQNIWQFYFKNALRMSFVYLCQKCMTIQVNCGMTYDGHDASTRADVVRVASLYPWLSLSIFVPIFSSVHSELHILLYVYLHTAATYQATYCVYIIISCTVGMWVESSSSNIVRFSTIQPCTHSSFICQHRRRRRRCRRRCRIRFNILCASSPHTRTPINSALGLGLPFDFVLDKIIHIVYTQKLRGQKFIKTSGMARKK